MRTNGSACLSAPCWKGTMTPLLRHRRRKRWWPMRLPRHRKKPLPLCRMPLGLRKKPLPRRRPRKKRLPPKQPLLLKLSKRLRRNKRTARMKAASPCRCTGTSFVYVKSKTAQNSAGGCAKIRRRSPFYRAAAKRNRRHVHRGLFEPAKSGPYLFCGPFGRRPQNLKKKSIDKPGGLWHCITGFATGRGFAAFKRGKALF